ncbi:MAG: hypothetical protein IJ801_04255 [Lachnospiraceae bacterium]|nr:hypothetical protein [Lachnospiraceae bacterium]
MKRVIGIMVCCICILSLSVGHAAAQNTDAGNRILSEGDNGTDAPTPQQQRTDDMQQDEAGENAAADAEGTVTLSIDNQNVYEGMKKAYKNGYMPSVSDNKVLLILPLTADGELKNNELTASVDLGATQHSPFTYKNYEKTFSLAEMPVNGTSRQNQIYYIRFDLSLVKVRYNGIYPVTVIVSAKDGKEHAISQSFTIYISITDGRDPDGTDDAESNSGEDVPAPEAGGGETTPTPEPVVLVSACSLKPGTVEAGTDFTATVTIKNTNMAKDVQNMVITVDYDNEAFCFMDASESIYVTGLGKGSSMELPVHFHVNRNTREGNYKITFNMNYDNADAATLNSTGSIAIPVRQMMKVELTVPQIARSVTAGDTLPLDFQVMNLGRSKVYNVRCNIEGEGLVETSTAFIGNLEGGTDGTASMNLFISTKDQAEGEQYGSTEGVITMTYEDAEGQEYTQDFSFMTTIEKPEFSTGNKKEDEKRSAGQWWVSVVVLAVVIAGIGIVFVSRKRRENELD